MITAAPLTWPDGWERTNFRVDSQFGKVGRDLTIARATNFIYHELDLKGVCDWNVIVSTDLDLRRDGRPYSNQRKPDDPGAAVWWKEKNSDTVRQVIAIDKYLTIADNLYAIGKTIEALRSIKRWGSGEILTRAQAGLFAELPSPEQAGGLSWRAALGFTTDNNVLNIDVVRARYRSRRSLYHEDRPETADPELFHQVQIAWEQAQRELSE